MKKILIADDDHDTVEVLSASLKAKDVEAIMEQKPDVLILDLFMPLVDGSVAFDYIRQTATTHEDAQMREYLAKVPIIILSGFIDSKTREWFNGRSIAASFVKPPDIKTLIKKIRELTRDQS